MMLLQRSTGDDRNRMLVQMGAFTGFSAAGEDFHGVVVATDQDEAHDGEGNEKQGDPGALGEFRNQNHRGGDAGNCRSQPIYECALQPVRAAIFLPVHHHAGLREREGQERADGIERDQPVRDSPEKQENAAT